MTIPDFEITREMIVEVESPDEELLDKCTLLGVVKPQAYQRHCVARGFNLENVPSEVRKDIIDGLLIRVAGEYLRAVGWNPTARYVFQCREFAEAFTGSKQPPDLSDENASVWYMEDWV